MLAGNQAMQRLVERVFPQAAATVDHAEITYRGDLSAWRREEPSAA